MNILVIGDISGKPGRKMIREILPKIKDKMEIEFTIANGENAAGGVGITREIANELFYHGIDILTMGNHTWDNKDIFNFIDHERRILRPLNYPDGTPGQGSTIIEAPNGLKIGIINLLGRVFLANVECPFRTVEKEIAHLQKETPIILIDFHAEVTSEKVALGWYLDGKVTAVVGTHTHIQTADERILPKGTAYITDLGMTGSRNSVLGVKTELVIQKFLTQLPVRFEVAKGDEVLCGAIIEIDSNTGKAVKIERVQEFSV